MTTEFVRVLALGVHWHFDAAAAADIYSEPDELKPAKEIVYTNVWRPGRDPEDLPTGGIPLGLGIANDIFVNNMQLKVPDEKKAKFQLESPSKRTNTTYHTDI